MPAPAPGWLLFSRLGEAQLLLPAMLAGLAWLWLVPATRPLAWRWAAAGLAATAVTTISKIAFIGYEFGIAAIDFTGFSGHAMYAALVLPVLARVAAPSARPWPPIATAAGFALAAAIAVSRVVVHAHSASEAASGFALGAAASVFALSHPARRGAPPYWLAAGVAAWLLAMPFNAPRSRTHDWVTALSLELSGRPSPYTRREMHLRARVGSEPLRRLPAREVQRDPVRERQLAGDGIGARVFGDL